MQFDPATFQNKIEVCGRRLGISVFSKVKSQRHWENQTLYSFDNDILKDTKKISNSNKSYCSFSVRIVPFWLLEKNLNFVLFVFVLLF